MNFIIWGILARACELYRVRVCGFVILGNHFHFIIVVERPEDVPAWIGYVKAEIAHAVNKLQGKRRKTVWQEGCDSPILLTPEDVVRYMAYIYANPAKANLEDSIDKYPGVSSWEMFVNNESHKFCKRVSRPRLERIEGTCQSINEQKALVSTLEREIKKVSKLTIEPFAWIDSFDELTRADIPDLREEIVSRVRGLESEARVARKSMGRSILGATALRRQSMDKQYEPKKFSPKMICISSCKELRKRFLGYYRSLCEYAKEAYEAWRRGDYSRKIPPGMFAPPPPLLASALPLRV